MTTLTRIALVSAGALVAASLIVFATQAQESPAPAAGQPSGAELFAPIASVLMHPRCLNCHQVDFPRQKDSGIRHTQLVVRGISGESHGEGHGAPTLPCNTCHQATNTADGRVPGTPNWSLAPVSMKWAELSAAQICAQLKDPERNGHRSDARAVVEHMGAYQGHVDPLVLWAWQPGAGRSTPPIPHEEFVAALEAWAEAGMPCPADGA